jgi:hypothetical protein
MTREEVAALVCSTLAAAGIEVVLSGGAVVSIYSDNAYESDDLDLIATGLARDPGPVMRELGFSRQHRYWRHPSSRYWVEFPPGPVGVGARVVTEFAERETAVGVLLLLSPTDCVMDRLAAYYHWKDPQALEQAVAVATRHPVDLTAIEDWSREEGASERFSEFEERVTPASVGPSR